MTKELSEGDLKGRVPQPYTTNNAALAAALTICGVRHPVSAGIVYPGYNLYTIEFLRTFPDLKGLGADDAIRKLFYRGIPGNVVYAFERGGNFAELIEGWEEAAKAITKSETADPNMLTETVKVDCSIKDIGKIARQLSQTRKVFFGDKNTVPVWRRRSANGELFMPACYAKTTGRIERGDAGTKKSTIIGSGNYHSVSIPPLPAKR